MDTSKQPDLPSYEHQGAQSEMDAKQSVVPPPEAHEGAPSYEEPPTYHGGSGRLPAHSTGLTLTLDPTGTFIKEVPLSDAPALYTLSASLLKVKLTSSIHVTRPVEKGGEVSPVAVFAIGDRWVSPLLSRRPLLQNITVARSTGLVALAHLREIVWDFSTYIIPKKREDEAGKGKGSLPPTADGFLVGMIMDQFAVQKHLLRFYSGKWVDEQNEILALEREGGNEYGGMPVLSVTKDLDQETLDFLVSAWCVTMWGDVGKRAQKSKSTGKKYSIFGF